MKHFCGTAAEVKMLTFCSIKIFDDNLAGIVCLFITNGFQSNRKSLITSLKTKLSRLNKKLRYKNHILQNSAFHVMIVAADKYDLFPFWPKQNISFVKETVQATKPTDS